jgi:hypothetical protein
MELEIHIFRDPDKGFYSVPMPKGSTREAALTQVSSGVWPKKINPEPEDIAANMNSNDIDIFDIDRHGEVATPRYPAEYFDRYEYYGTISITKITGFGGY